MIIAKAWREMGPENLLASVEVAARVLDDFIKGEALDEPSTLARVMQLLDISGKFQELAMSVIKAEAEKYAHL